MSRPLARSWLAVLLSPLCVVLALQAQSSDAAPRLTPTTYRSHFQPDPGVSASSGSRDGWESYPISQEAGYDATINPETISGVSALVRESALLHDGHDQLGFIRRTHMVTGPASSIRFRVQVPYAVSVTTLHVVLYRGQAEEQHSLTVSGNRWQDVALPLPPGSAPLSAIAIAADFPHAVYGRTERFLLADVTIHALALKRIDLLASQALWDPTREIYYIKQALHPGDQLDVSLASRSFKGLHWTLASPDGQLVEQGSDTPIRHRFNPEEKTGIYTLHIRGREAVTDALLLLKPAASQGLIFDKPPAISPELMQSIRDRRAVLEKTANSGLGRNIAVMDSHWLLPGLPSYFDILLQAPELAMLDAMEYSSTHDPAALARSLSLLHGIATWPEWVHPWFPAHGYHSYYPVGIMTKYLVLAEQFLGSDLPEADRRVLGQRLLELSIKPIYQEYVQEDRLQFNTSNWIGNTAGGALLAAVANDSPDAAGYALGLFIKERDHVQVAYTADGSYGEGVSYHRFDLEMTSLVAAASKRLLGVSIDSSLGESQRYLQYAAYASNSIVDFGDSHVDLRPSNVFAYQASLNQSDELASFYFNDRDTGTAQIISRVLFEASIKPPTRDPSQPATSVLFQDRGIAILRDSWKPDATVIAMRAGPNFNHNHADQGSLFFAHNGKLWLGEAGYADYYKDPSYQGFNIQAIGHNTLLLDHNPESQVIPGNEIFGVYPRITHSLLGPSASLVQADLTSAYGSALQHYTRTLFFQAGGPLIVIDDIAAASPHSYTLVWHPKQSIASFSPETHAFRLSDGKEAFALQTFGSIALLSEEKPSPLPLVDYERSEHELITSPTHVEFSTKTATRDATIVTVMDSQDGASGAGSSAEWQHNTNADHLHTNGVDVQILNLGGPSSGALEKTILVRSAQDSFMLNGTRYDAPDSSYSIAASQSIDIHLSRTAGSVVQLEVNAKSPAKLSIRGVSNLQQASCRPGIACDPPAPGNFSVAAGRSSFSFLVQSLSNH